MDFLKDNEDDLCIWLSSDPESIIDKCGDFLTRNHSKDLDKESDGKKKILRLIKIIIGMGEDKCLEFKEILKLQKQIPDLQQLLNNSTQASTGRKMFADNSSIIDNRSFTKTEMKSLTMQVELPSNSAECSNQPGQRVSQPPRGADCIATNNSYIFNNTIQDCNIGDVDLSIRRQMPTGPPKTKGKSSSAISDKPDFLRRNRSMIVSKVQNIGPIVDDLQSQGYHPEMAATVRAQLTPQKMMRKLLDSTNSNRAAEDLIEALFKHQSDVMEDLMSGKG